ncbi:MAG: hypothetical protein LBQ39_00990 [Tannerellaceae bacterium]|jgi:hypothetical protein|nr:hypothetical protein [Tannerellaceae bacterium]
MMKKIVYLCAMCCVYTASLFSQSIVLTSGTIDFVKKSSVIEFIFTYDDMLVGKMTEMEYIDKKVGDFNKKEEGRGDSWKRAWLGDRQARFEPKFKELFDKYLEKHDIVAGEEGADYRIVINTDFTEPGWNVGVMRMNASLDLTCKVFDTASGQPVAVIKVRNCSANNFSGTDFDTGFRIQECYAKAGRELAKFFIKKAKLK